MEGAGIVGTLKIFDGVDWVEILPTLEDHGTLSGLEDDDHTHYSRADGTRAFTGTVNGVDPTASGHLATRNYVENAATKSLTVEQPNDSEDISWFKTPISRTIDTLTPTINGATASGITWTVRYDSDRYATGTEVVTGGTNTHSGTGGNNATDISSFDDPNIPANSFVWVETTTSSGIMDEFSLTLV